MYSSCLVVFRNTVVQILVAVSIYLITTVSADEIPAFLNLGTWICDCQRHF